LFAAGLSLEAVTRPIAVVGAAFGFGGCVCRAAAGREVLGGSLRCPRPPTARLSIVDGRDTRTRLSSSARAGSGWSRRPTGWRPQGCRPRRSRQRGAHVRSRNGLARASTSARGIRAPPPAAVRHRGGAGPRQTSLAPVRPRSGAAVPGRGCRRLLQPSPGLRSVVAMCVRDVQQQGQVEIDTAGRRRGRRPRARELPIVGPHHAGIEGAATDVDTTRERPAGIERPSRRPKYRAAATAGDPGDACPGSPAGGVTQYSDASDVPPAGWVSVKRSRRCAPHRPAPPRRGTRVYRPAPPVGHA